MTDQIPREQLASMTATEIAAAAKDGQLEAVKRGEPVVSEAERQAAEADLRDYLASVMRPDAEIERHLPKPSATPSPAPLPGQGMNTQPPERITDSASLRRALQTMSPAEIVERRRRGDFEQFGVPAK